MQMHILEQHMDLASSTAEAPWPILICLLGNFRLLHAGHPVAIPCGGKVETLLSRLSIQPNHRASCRVLLDFLWPTRDSTLAHQSLNSLVYSLHKLIGDALGGAAAVLHEDGYYRLNIEAGVYVDVARFDAWADTGDQQVRAGDLAGAATSYRQSVHLYRGDLSIEMDVGSVLERERLRSRFLSLLAYLADQHYRSGDYGACLAQAWRLLGYDPCREDAHRVVMRCYLRRGERAAALRHYHICERILHAEFDAAPEPATTALFDQIRLNPATFDTQPQGYFIPYPDPPHS
jgi:DNA-binding SARP family transcriptional activator